MDELASDEFGSLKIENRVDNLANLAHATERMQAGKGFMAFWGVHRRFNDARSDRIHPNPVLSVFDR
jgi:hypothetical protein